MRTPRYIRIPLVHLYGEDNLAVCGRADRIGEVLYGDPGEVTCWRCLEQQTLFCACQCAQCVAVRSAQPGAVAEVVIEIPSGEVRQ